MIDNGNIVIIAGEVSGDMHAAALVRAMRQDRPELRFTGIGGDEMAAAGVTLRHHVRDMAVVGFAEVLRRFFFFRRVFYEMVRLVREERPRAVILVDYPGFNLRLAAKVHALGVKVVYYICPQVWAWNRSRIPRMARIIDRLITIFPFEEAVFSETRMKVAFAGHPLVDEARLVLATPAAKLPCEGDPLVALLPGSRLHEIERLLPVMWRAAALIETSFPNAVFVVAAPTEETEQTARGVIEQLKDGPQRWHLVTGQTRNVLRQSRAALVASGTATLEASLMRCPMVVAYRMATTTYVLAKLLVRLRHIAMVNIVAGKQVCPEFIQHKATPRALAAAVKPFLEPGPERERVVRELDEVNAALGAGGAAERAARMVLEEMGIGD